MKCQKCLKDYKDKVIHRHHILPYSLFKTYDCQTIILCKWCHRKLHNDLELLGYTLKEKIEQFTKNWLNGTQIKKEIEEIYPLCPICKKEKNRLSFLYCGSDYVVLFCRECGYQSPKNKEVYILWERKARREDSIQYKQLKFGKQDKILKKEDESLL